VGDFMANISKALTRAGINVVRTTLTRHGFVTAVALMIRSHICPEETVYISYPTEGYGKSMWPFLLAIGSHRRIVLHLHEYGSKNRYCRFLLRRFQNMRRVFFSNAEDFQRFVSDCGLRPDHPRIVEWQVVPTPSNIPITATADHRDLDRLRVVHFGQIRPNKGLEQLAAAFDFLHSEPQLDRLLMGGVPKGYEAYAAAISDTFSKSGTKVRLNRTPEEISEVFANAQIGVFPFPDGADERRGSLIAAMAHGVLCVTTHSARTPDAIKAATIGIEVKPENVGAQAIADAVRCAAATISSRENMHRIVLAKSLGAKVSFSGIAQIIINI
jgi:glycosyltransferase involved in cell wall biosynthesis